MRHSRLISRASAALVTVFALLHSQTATINFAAGGCGTATFRPAPVYNTGAAPRSAATGDFNGDGKPDLAVANYDGNSVSIFLNDASGAFTESSVLGVGGGPFSVAVGDLNGDGKLDLMTANNSTSDISVLLGDGSGRFAPASNIFAGAGPRSVAIADFNRDGKADLAVATESGNSVAVLSGDGAGRFGPPRSFTVGQQPHFVAAGDFNGDGKIDLAVAIIGETQVLIGDGAGTFSRVTTSCTGFSADSLIVTDIDGDGKPDLVGASILSDTVSIARGTGGNCFAAPTNFSITPGPGLAHNPYTLVVADVNGDGKLDVATANGGSNNVSLLLGDGSGGLGAPTTYGAGRFPRGLASADFDGDGKADLVTTNSEGNSASVLFGSAAGGFRFATGPGTVAVAVADFNKDGKPDLAVTASGVSILLGDGSGNYSGGKKFAAGTAPVSIAVADFNRDGNADVVVAGRGANNASDIFMLLGDGNGNLGTPTASGVGPDPFAVAAADLNGDGNFDVVTANRFGTNISVLLGDGRGGFATATNFPAEHMSNPQSIAVGDFNGDGKPDLAVPTSNGATVFLNNGAGGFPARVSYAAGTNTQSITTADFDGDGKLDLAAANAGSNNVSVLLGTGDGSFAPAINFSTGAGRPGGGPQSVVSADFNLDGALDLATVNQMTPPDQSLITYNVSVILGDGKGGFGALTIYPAEAAPWAVTAGDVNGDGRHDLVTANNGAGNVSVLLNSCAAVIAPPIIQFDLAGYTYSEGSPGGAVLRVSRAGDASAAVKVDYRTLDDPAPVPCDPAAKQPDGSPYPQGKAYARCDYATAVGTLTFSPGETSKTVAVPLIDDSYVEGPETFRVALSNPVGATLGAPTTTTVTLLDNDVPGEPNPILSTPFFVRQQYLDFFGREPDAGGFAAWKATLDNCPDPFNTNPAAPSANCDRVSVSKNFFRSKEFELKGGYVFTFYKVAFSRLPRYSEIVPDMASLTAVDDAGFFAKKAAFTNEFVQRQEFKTLYDALTNQQFVDALMSKYNLQQITAPDPATPDDTSQAAKVTLTRADLANRLGGATMTRAQVLRAVSDSDQVRAAEANSSFVAMQYFGYLRRDPEQGGYNDWLRTINANPSDIRSMVNGFVNSTEYRLRFGQP